MDIFRHGCPNDLVLLSYFVFFCGMHSDDFYVHRVEILGAALMTTFDAKTTWADLYESESIGGLLSGPLVGAMHGFGSFCMVILGLSIVGNNIPNMYSFACTFQVLGPWAMAIPRPFIVLLATILYTVSAFLLLLLSLCFRSSTQFHLIKGAGNRRPGFFRACLRKSTSIPGLLAGDVLDYNRRRAFDLSQRQMVKVGPSVTRRKYCSLDGV